MIWKEKRTLLIILGVLLFANTIFFFTYRVQYQNRLDELDARLQDAERSLSNARRERVAAQATMNGYRSVERDVQRVFDEHWSTQEQRLTLLITEVKRLALASSMQPAAYSFDRTEAVSISERGRRPTELGVTSVGIRFAVDGTYEQMRRLINLLELSRQFVIVDQIGLVSRDGAQLNMSLHLTTLFRNEPQRPAENRL